MTASRQEETIALNAAWSNFGIRHLTSVFSTHTVMRGWSYVERPWLLQRITHDSRVNGHIHDDRGMRIHAYVRAEHSHTECVGRKSASHKCRNSGWSKLRSSGSGNGVGKAL